MEQPHLFEGPVEHVHVVLVKTDPTGWRLRLSQRREGDLGWSEDLYVDVSIPEAVDVLDATLLAIGAPVE